MKVTYLFNKPRMRALSEVQTGNEYDDHFYGMLRLRKFDIDADFVELEQLLPIRLARFIRDYILSVYTIHIPLFFQLQKADVIFSPTAFGTQLFHALYPWKKPLWIMFDFNIAGLLNRSRGLKKHLLTYIVQKSAGIVTLSQAEKDRLIRLFPNKADTISFLPFGTDTRFFSPQPSIHEDHQILSPGQDRGRDLATLFEACVELGVKTVLTGHRKHLQKYEPLPTFATTQFFSSKDLVHQYQLSKIVVLPLDISDGTNEAMGCSTLVEAMAMGKAIIATRTPTTESYICHGENGLLVPPKDPQALREAINLLLRDESLRKNLGVSARLFAETHCDADIFANNLATFFRKVYTLNEGNRRIL